MREFKIRDRVRVTKSRASGAGITHSLKGVVVQILKDESFAQVNHGTSYQKIGWCFSSLEFDNNHKQPCACYECEE